jgi:cell division protein ZipA
MGPFRWVLLLIGIGVICLIFAYSRGLLPNRKAFSKLPRLRRAPPVLHESEPEPELRQPEERAKPKAPRITSDSKVVTVRIMPPAGKKFPAEELVLALRSVGLRHGEFGIFHRMAETEGGSGGKADRIRYSVASLVEPGSFDLSNLKDSEYLGISIFMLLPAPEDGVKIFDEMLATAREIARQVNGRLTDEQGGAMSVQRERYMREEVIEFLRQHVRTGVQTIFSANT